MGSNPSPTNWKAERIAAEDAARKAGQLLADLWGQVRVHHKGPKDLVTEADVRAQELIHDRLLEEFPADGFLGEEQGSIGKPAPSASEKEDRERTDGKGPSQRRWVVDPLDGTTNFVHGMPMFCTSIGLEADGELVVGVVYDPIRDEMFSAAKGLGASVNEQDLEVSQAGRLDESLVNIGLPSDLRADADPAKRLLMLANRAQSVRRLGSAAIALAYVAAGRLDAFVADVLQPWDSAGGVVLVHEAGGLVTHLDRAAYTVNRPDLVATNGMVHDEFLQELANSIK